jgi:diguanylate cyclase (GGDEF)-like protein
MKTGQYVGNWTPKTLRSTRLADRVIRFLDARAARATTRAQSTRGAAEPDRSNNRFQFWTQLVAVAVVVAYAASLFWSVRNGSSPSLVGWLGRAALAVPLVPISERVWHRSELRGAWLTMGLAVALFNVASLLDLITVARVVPFVTGTPRDVIYLLSYVAVAIAVSVVGQQSFGPRAFSVRLDGAIVVLTIAAWTSMYWFRQDVETTGRTLVAELNMFNPILVVALIVFLLAGLVPKHSRLDVSTSCLLVGLTSFAAGDVIELNHAVFNVAAAGALVEVSRPVALCCIALAAWPRVDRRGEVAALMEPVRGLNLLPVIFGTLSIAILAVSIVKSLPEATKCMALGSLLLVIIRMVMTQGEVRQLGRSNYLDARTDHVTGLSNRRGFLEDGGARLAELKPSEQLGIVLIDLDGFKEVNDSIGHAYGDELLRVVGQRFAKRVAARGTLARVGGDEFAYTFVIDASADPCASAKDLASTLADPVLLDGTSVRVSASVGVAVWPQHGATHAELLRSADVAMYEAKRNRGGVCVYSDAIDVNSRERLSLINELRTAIERHRLTLHFQPTRDQRTRTVYGVEALVRWQHPTRGLLYPADFVPLAEQVGLIVPLTHTVLDLAINELARLDRAGHSLQMNVNISQQDLTDLQLPIVLDRILQWYKVPPQRITLEVTESSLSHDPVRAKQSLERLRDAGVRISIDDFGVGYSSMSQLLDLPVDELKIDKSFVLALESDPRAISLIRSMVEMARALGLVTIAEGIENARNYDALQLVGADIMQGDYVARPLTSAELDDFLRGEGGAPTLDVDAPDGLFETIGSEELLVRVQDEEPRVAARTERPRHVVVGNGHVRSD